MLFGDYIKVRKNNNKWEIIEKFKRYHSTEIWKPLFETLLNLENCRSPDLTHFIDSLNEYVKQNGTQVLRDSTELEILVDSQNKKKK